jgi:hypothetical protein
MSQQQLDYATPVSPRTPEQIRAGRVAVGAVVVVWALANFFVVSSAATDLDGFHAMGTAVFGAIFVNAIVLIGSLIFVGRVSRAAGKQVVLWYLAAAVLLPVSASFGDFFVAAWMRR